MARHSIETGITALTTAGAVLVGATACSSAANNHPLERHPSAAIIGTYTPHPQPGETHAGLSPCRISISWLTAHSIRLTLNKPAGVTGSIMDMNVQWGNGAGDAENATSIPGGSLLPSAVPIVGEGQPVEAGPETFKDGMYKVSAELGIMQSGHMSGLACSRVISVPHG